jgi:hypothetical protein
MNFGNCVLQKEIVIFEIPYLIPSIIVACLNCRTLQGLFGLSDREINRIFKI